MDLYLSHVRNSRYWRFIIWLDRPQGQVIWGLLIALLAGSTALLQNIPIAYMISLIIIFIPKAWIEYSLSELKNVIKDEHHKRVENQILTYLKKGQIIIKQDSEESLEMAIMLPTRDNTYWAAGIYYNLSASRMYFRFKQHVPSWLVFAEEKNAQAKAIRLDEIIKKSFLPDPRDLSCFEDIFGVLVVPIHKPNAEKIYLNLLGILLIYTNTEKSIFLSKETEKKCETYAQKLSEKIAPVLCYECMCT